jgi:hypothetical protein
MTSHAKTVSPTPIEAKPSREGFEAARQQDAPEQRPSRMVANDRPQPVPRPSPGMAGEADRQAFNQRWNDEAREARKAAFIRERTLQIETVRQHTRSQSFNRSSIRSR